MAAELTYTDDLAEQIASMIAEDGKSFSEACAAAGVSRRTARSWIERNPEFEHKIEIASRLRVDGFVDDMVSLADGVRSSDSNAEVQAARLAIDTRKWVAAKLLPSRYGDALQLTGAGGKDLMPAPEAKVPQLMQVLALLLPDAANSELHTLATAMVERVTTAALPKVS